MSQSESQGILGSAFAVEDRIRDRITLWKGLVALKSLPLWIVFCGVLCGQPSPAADMGSPAGFDEVSDVFIVVFGFGDARVGAWLIDREGRRIGWNAVDGLYREIPGCWHSAGSDEGIPDESAPLDTTEEAPGDTVAGGLEATPLYHEFMILGSAHYALYDSTVRLTPKLLDEGGCELRLDPLATGRVTLAITGSGTLESGIGRDACQDTTSAFVKTGVPSRWWLSWRTEGNKCIVKVSELRAPAGSRR